MTAIAQQLEVLRRIATFSARSYWARTGRLADSRILGYGGLREVPAYGYRSRFAVPTGH